MNFTVIASIISILIIAFYASSSHDRLYNIDYTPLSKLGVLDYIVCVNALASGEIEHMLSEGFRNAGLYVSYRIDEKVLRKDLKRLVLTVDHGYVKVSISAELGLRLLRNESRLTPSGVEYVYLVKVWADRPVALKGIDIVSANGSKYVGWTSGRVCDNRGICVEVP